MILKEIFRVGGWTWGWLSFAFCLVNLSVYIWPLIAKDYLDRMIKGDPVHIPFVSILALSSIVITRILLQSWVKKTSFRLSQELCANLRQKIYTHLQQLSFHRIKGIQQADVLTRCSLDVENIRRFLSSEALEGAMAVLNVVFLVGVLFCLNAWLTLSVAFLVPLLVLLCVREFPSLKEGFAEIQKNNQRLIQDMGEIVQACGIVRAMGLERFLQDRFQESQKKAVELNRLNYDKSLRLMLSFESANAAALVVVFLGGMYLIHNHYLTVGTLVAFSMYWSMLTGPIMRLGHIQTSLQEVLGSIRNIEAFLGGVDPAPCSGPKAVKLKQVAGDIIFNGVSFNYCPNQPVLRQIQWTIQPGKMVALVGQSGAGKTTLLQLLLRFYDPHKGNILVDGRDLRNLDLESFRQKISVVMQDDFIFSGSLKDNLVLGNRLLSDEDITHALKAACAFDFVRGLRGGYQARIGERGFGLSVGQRQRLAIARALLRRPQILLLDEATCSLDALTENEVQRNIREFCPESTILIIAHRFSTIMEADHIAVIDDGKIIQEGDHAILLSQQGLYSRLYREQFK